MWGEVIIGGVLGFVGGIVTGFFFERRATKSAEKQNAQLRRDLETLRTTVYSLGGDPDLQAPPPPTAGLEEALLTRMRATQDAGGRVAHRKLVAYFARSGYDPKDVETTLDALTHRGAIREDGTWLQIL